MDIIRSFDVQQLRDTFLSGNPVPFFCIDNFLNEDFANQVFASFPTFEEVKQIGRSFNAVNEKQKVQVTDAKQFSEPIAELHTVLSSPEFLAKMSQITGMPNLLADEELKGGGIHQTGPRGSLDVHVDFNYIPGRQLHRRLNILVYFNKGWDEGWGGRFELWDRDVRVCKQSFAPLFNRCVVFETNEISFHGVTAVTCPPGVSRKSFAAYYYTREAPAHWTGTSHTTIFRARPWEYRKKYIEMPVEKVSRFATRIARKIGQRLHAESKRAGDGASR
jgi:Rps23 Pro-64 3,4-dihydroxylase Tpa1-like proline 4-hydroxylase